MADDESETARREAVETIWPSVASIMAAESKKAGVLVSHSASLGTLREKIVRRVLTEFLPQRVAIETGIVSNPSFFDRNLKKFILRNSSQLDILLHDAHNRPVMYRLDDFVIVHPVSCFAAIEVKSTLNSKEFSDICEKQLKLRNCSNRPQSTGELHCFAFQGLKFESLVELMMGQRLEHNFDPIGFVNYPVSIVCHRQNYFCFRPCESTDLPGTKISSRFYCFVKSKTQVGFATALFIAFMQRHFDKHMRAAYGAKPTAGDVLHWYNGLDEQHFEKCYMDKNFRIHNGNIPLPSLLSDDANS